MLQLKMARVLLAVCTTDIATRWQIFQLKVHSVCNARELSIVVCSEAEVLATVAGMEIYTTASKL